nr:immunoglobulin light chain junction region [Macaca mulatta]MOX54076.1 immunoglobulin light chain junction region [Macaca mulatta]MOX56217.1 immunoglobulin light chain junction region [Macaca mulatta]
CQQYNNWIRF